jgi:hypothetical protein
MTLQPAVDHLSPGDDLLYDVTLDFRDSTGGNSAVLVEHSLPGVTASSKLKRTCQDRPFKVFFPWPSPALCYRITSLAGSTSNWHTSHVLPAVWSMTDPCCWTTPVFSCFRCASAHSHRVSAPSALQLVESTLPGIASPGTFRFQVFPTS